jgi:predicted ATPase/DNA-binding CsgD family transcriptional regulator
MAVRPKLVDPVHGRLPSRLTPFIGRRPDLERMLQILRDPSARLVTIVGPGGVGKTSLAIELAAKLQPAYEDGVVYVPLAHLSKLDELLPALAESLDVQLPPGGDLQQAVEDHLSNRNLLLVLDSFEQLLDEALLIRDILVAAPGVRVLVTSRERLSLEAENLYHLNGLELPVAEDQPHAEDCDAVRLFLQKARQINARFALDDTNAPAVTRICRYVDGNPLGILLAASWVEHFTPSEIEAQVRRDLDFLNRDLRDIEQRHAGIRVVFASSFERLDGRQGAVLRGLSVFRGGFSAEAARAILDADQGLLIALVGKSLMARELGSGRYDLHGLLQQFAAEELVIAGEGEAVAAAYMAYYVAFVRRREAQVVGRLQAGALDEIQADFENIRQTWSMLIERRDFSAAREMLPCLYAYCDMRSRFYEGEAIFHEAVQGLRPQADEPPDSAWGLALLSWFDMRKYIEPFESLVQLSSQAGSCLSQARARGDEQGIAASLVLLGAIAQDEGDYGLAIRRYEEAMRCFPALDDAYWVNMRIGLSYKAARDYSRAIVAFQLSLRRSQECGENVKAGWSLQNIGDTLLVQGKMADAQKCLGQAHELFKEIGTSVGVLWSTHSLSLLAIESGNHDLALKLAGDAAQLARDIHSASWIAKTEALLRKIDLGLASRAVGSDLHDGQSLSQREMDVLQLLKSEMSGPEIACRLAVSLNTVRYHTKHIYQKLGVNNRLAAIARAKELGL